MKKIIYDMYILYIKDNILDSILKDPSEFSRMVNLEEEWEVLTQVTKHPETCQGYIPTLWEISRWISANEGMYFYATSYLLVLIALHSTCQRPKSEN